MNWVKGFALVTCLAAPISVITVASAMADTAPSTAPAAGSMMKKPKLTDEEKKAKAADCSKQANAKKLHGEEREKFRAACKKA